MGDTVGRVHMQPQDLSKLQTRKVKALKKRKSEDGLDSKGKKVKLGLLAKVMDQ